MNVITETQKTILPSMRLQTSPAATVYKPQPAYKIEDIISSRTLPSLPSPASNIEGTSSPHTSFVNYQRAIPPSFFRRASAFEWTLLNNHPARRASLPYARPMMPHVSRESVSSSHRTSTSSYSSYKPTPQSYITPSTPPRDCNDWTTAMPPVNNEDESDPRGIYRCPRTGCDKYFTRKFNLSSHQRIHTGVRPYPCLLCTSEFSRKHDLRRHVKSLHSETKSHKCNHCNLSFARGDALRRHMISVSAKCDSSHPRTYKPNAMPLPV